MKENPILVKSYNFSVIAVRYCLAMQAEKKEFVISRQLLKSATSIGANVEEAQSAVSKAEFIVKLQISLKEAKETKYWLRLIKDAEVFASEKTEALLKDCNELIVLLTSILKTSKS